MEAFRLKENAPGREEHCQKSGAGRFLKLTDGDAFPTKSSGAPNDHPNSSEGGNLRTKGKKQYARLAGRSFPAATRNRVI